MKELACITGFFVGMLLVVGGLPILLLLLGVNSMLVTYISIAVSFCCLIVLAAVAEPGG